MEKNNTFAWVSYLTVFGWLIALIMYNGSQKGNTLVRFHIRQSLGIFLLAFAAYILRGLPFLGGVIASIVSIAVVVFWVMGLISAIQGEEKPVPLVGSFFQSSLTFLN